MADYNHVIDNAVNTPIGVPTPDSSLISITPANHGSDFTPSSRREPCKLCGNESGHCRSSADGKLLLCHNSQYETDHPDLRFLGLTADGQWGKWVFPYADGNRPVYSEALKKNTPKPEKKFSPIPYRTAQIGDWLAAHPINAARGHLLLNRGFTLEAIAWFGFGQDKGGLVGAVPAGPTLRAGLYRRLDNPGDGGRYRWSKQVDRHDPETGELVIACAFPPGQTRPPSDGVFFASEGLILKPQIVAIRSNRPVIGVGGCSGRLDRVSGQLSRYAAEYGIKTLRFLPDAGWALNKDVRAAIESLAAVCDGLGIGFEVGDWGQGDKAKTDKLDPDEVDWGVVAAAKFAPLTQRLDAANPEPSEPSQPSAEDIAAAKAAKDLADRERYEKLAGLDYLALYSGGSTEGLTYKPSSTVNRRYTDPSDHDAGLPGLHLVMGAMGSGKSFAILKTAIQNTLSRGKRVAILTSRINLGLQQIRDLTGGKGSMVNDFEGDCSTLQCVVSCYESSWRLGGDFDLIVCDEIELASESINLSSTCRQKRGEIRAAVRRLLRGCLAQGGSVVMADANPSQPTIDLMTGICGRDKLDYFFLNSHPPQQRRTFFGTDKTAREFIWEAAQHDIFLTAESYGAGEDSRPNIPMIVADSQGKLEDFDGVFTAAIMGDDTNESIDRLAREIDTRYPGLLRKHPLIRIDAKTSSDKEIKAFIQDPDGEIERRQPLAIICSPSVFVGFNVTSDRVKNVYASFCGVLEPKMARQALNRARKAKSWTIYAAPSFNCVSGAKSFDPDVIYQYLKDGFETAGFNATEGTLFDQNRMIAAALAAKGSHLSDGDLLAKLNSLYDFSSDRWNTPEIRFVTEALARKNYARRHFGELLQQELILEGQTLEPIHAANEALFGDCPSVSTGLLDTMADERDRRGDREAAQMAGFARDSEQTPDEAAKVLRDPSATHEKRLEARATLLRDRDLPGLEIGGRPVWTTPELSTPIFRWLCDDPAHLGKLKTRWQVSNQSAAQLLAVWPKLKALAADGFVAIDDWSGGRVAKARAIASMLKSGPGGYHDPSLLVGEWEHGTAKIIDYGNSTEKFTPAKRFFALSKAQRSQLGFKLGTVPGKTKATAIDSASIVAGVAELLGFKVAYKANSGRCVVMAAAESIPESIQDWGDRTNTEIDPALTESAIETALMQAINRSQTARVNEFTAEIVPVDVTPLTQPTPVAPIAPVIEPVIVTQLAIEPEPLADDDLPDWVISDSPATPVNPVVKDANYWAAVSAAAIPTYPEWLAKDRLVRIVGGAIARVVGYGREFIEVLRDGLDRSKSEFFAPGLLTPLEAV